MYANLNNNAKIVKLVCTKNNLLCVLNGNINILIKKKNYKILAKIGIKYS